MSAQDRERRLAIESELPHGATLRDRLQVVRRRKWLVLTGALVVTAASVAWSLHQPPLYEASSAVALNQLNQAALLAGAQDAGTVQDQNQFMQSQADQATAAPLVRSVIRSVGIPAKDRPDLQVATKQDSNVLTFRAGARDQAAAAALANAYARRFIAYRDAADRAALAQAQKQVRARLRQLHAAGQESSMVYQALLGRDQDIQTLQALHASTASLVSSATGAGRVQPRPVRNGALALAIGLVFGVGLAFLFEAFDTSMRSAETIGRRLGLPLLGRLPRPSSRLRRKNQLVMLADPDGVRSEPFRILRTNLELANRDARNRVIMFTSALEQEGKSTTIANLAVAAARGGQRVLLVDLDLRRPYIDRFFDVPREPGFTDVVLGRAKLDEAVSRIPLAQPSRNGSAGQNGGGGVQGLLEVLPVGAIPPDAGDFLRLGEVDRVISELRRRADIVLVDVPPLLPVDDALGLSAKVDALVLVTRLELLRRSTVEELRRTIDRCPADKLGFVATESEREEGYGYGYGYGYPAYAPSDKELVS